MSLGDQAREGILIPRLKLALGVLTSVEQLVKVVRPPWSPECSLAVVPRVLVLVARPPLVARGFLGRGSSRVGPGRPPPLVA